MNCINFDQKFEQYMGVWMKNNAEKYKNNMDVIEGMMPDVYMEFLAKPATWLGGKAPQDYFGQFDDAAELVSWLCEYERRGVPVPDLLLDRIGELGDAAEAPLLALLDALADDSEDDAAMDALAQLLDSYMEAQQDFLDQSGLTQA